MLLLLLGLPLSFFQSRFWDGLGELSVPNPWITFLPLPETNHCSFGGPPCSLGPLDRPRAVRRCLCHKEPTAQRLFVDLECYHVRLGGPRLVSLLRSPLAPTALDEPRSIYCSLFSLDPATFFTGCTPGCLAYTPPSRPANSNIGLKMGFMDVPDIHRQTCIPLSLGIPRHNYCVHQPRFHPHHNLFRSLHLVHQRHKVVIMQMLEHLATVSAMCFSQTLHHISTTCPTSSALRRRYSLMFPFQTALFGRTTTTHPIRNSSHPHGIISSDTEQKGPLLYPLLCTPLLLS